MADTPLLPRRPQTRLHRRLSGSGGTPNLAVTPLSTNGFPAGLQAPPPGWLAPEPRPWPLLARCTSTPISQSELRTLLDFDEITVQPRATPTQPGLATDTSSSISSESGYDSWPSHGPDTPTSLGRAATPLERLRPWSQSKAPVQIRDLCSWDATASLEITADSIITRKRSNYTPGYFLHHERVDFLRHLFDRNMYEALRISFSYLDPPSLCHVAQVSPTWREALYSDFEAVRRKAAFLHRQKLNLENLSAEKSVLRSSPRKAMGNVSNLLSLSPSYAKREREDKSHAGHSKLVSPSKIRHQLFTQEASKLAPGEQLQACPRCTAPSRVTETSAQCSRRGCGFSFCTLCMCESHKDDTFCRTPGKTNGKSPKGSIASKRSKNRLKRL
ncbi:hypothetical protein TCAL_03952 [Tigriopus californicus]|uniref:ZBR-type domain-containing protein n=1 Tax=Tigriopus californicus TaxID=6832 RepID=A0A553P2Q8_TIGCA|nr:F-box only protein 43-like [Tigriopus californicus]TRY71985.1 hypothetical protein TCAL_03952 [Tigriopus californicus]